jgi:histidinol-phosphatase (PHP family)
MAQAALEAGMDELCLTDHCDLLSESGKLDLSFRWEPIEEQLALARPKFQGKLPIRMGLELGEPWEAPEFSQKLYAHPGLDLVLGSVHNLSSADGGQDFYFVDYKTEDDCYYVLDRYFACMEALAAMDCYDVLSHIIYPLRYMNGRDGNHATLDRYEGQLRRILTTVVDKGKAIECNTCRGRTVADWRWVLELYKDCGGTLITLGSDAHEPAHVGKGIPEAARLLKEIGFPAIAVYENHRPRPVSLA